MNLKSEGQHAEDHPMDTAISAALPVAEARGLLRGDPAVVAQWLLITARQGGLTGDDVVDALKVCLRAHRGEADEQAVAAADKIVAVSRRCDLLDQRTLLVHARVKAGKGDAVGAARAVVEAGRLAQDPVRDADVDKVLLLLEPHGYPVVFAFLNELRRAGGTTSPDGTSLMARAVVQRLTNVGGVQGIETVLGELETLRGFPDVVVAGKAFQLLRAAKGRTADHVTRLVDLALASCGLSPRLVDDGLTVLSELGEPEDVATLLLRAERSGILLTDSHHLKHAVALNNANRYHEAAAAYERYVADGREQTAYARRTHLQALVWGGAAQAAAQELLDWLAAVREGSAPAPAANLLRNVLVLVAQEDPAGSAPLLESLQGVVVLSQANGGRVLESVARSGSLEEYAHVLLALSRGGRKFRHQDLVTLVQLASGEPSLHVAAVLGEVCDAVPSAWPVCGPLLVVAQLAVGEVDRASLSAAAIGTREAVEQVALALLDARDVPAALEVSRLPVRHPPSEIPYTTTLARRLVAVLATTGGVKAAEEWFRGHTFPTHRWPVEVWAALARAYCRGSGDYLKVEAVIRRMRAVGTTPTAEVWAEWLVSFPRAERRTWLAHAREQMAGDVQPVTSHFVSVAVAASLVTTKVVPSSGHDPQDEVEASTRAALALGEAVLHEGIAVLREDHYESNSFTNPQLIEIARNYPLRRRPYAQLDAAVESRVAGLAGDAAVLAFLVTVAQAHGRAGNVEGAARIRGIATLLGEGDLPDLLAAEIEASSGDAETVRLLVRSAFATGERGIGITPALASTAGRALVASGALDMVVALATTPSSDLPPDVCGALVSSAIRRLTEESRHDEVRRLGQLAADCKITLDERAHLAMIGQHRAEPAVVQGPVWTTAELAAYNELLWHELANHVSATKSSIESLKRLHHLSMLHPDEYPVDLEPPAHYLTGIIDTLSSTQNKCRQTVAKIKAAAELERRSAGAVSVLEAIETVAQQLEPEAVGVRSSLCTIDVGSWSHLTVRVHATLLHFALYNLVSNAYKSHGRHKVEKPVEIIVTFTESSRDELDVAPYGWVVIAVRDHGDGVRADHPENVANWTTSPKPGISQGIGLKVTDSMVRNAGGQLWVDRAVDGGTRFCIRLPAARRKGGAISSPVHPSPLTVSPSANKN